MLDYRAHKLYWLISLPFRVAAKLTFFVLIVVSIGIAQSTTSAPPIKILIAYAAFELILLVLGLVAFSIISWALNRVFFFLIDVVPAHGANHVEAREIALAGRAFELSKKFETQIENWSDEDTTELVSHLNWRARLLFPSRTRTARTVRELKRIQRETGAQPIDVGSSGVIKIRESLPGGKPSLFEKALTTQSTFNSILALVIIAGAIIYMTPTGAFHM
jgi:hypothetical protein